MLELNPIWSNTQQQQHTFVLYSKGQYIRIGSSRLISLLFRSSTSWPYLTSVARTTNPRRISGRANRISGSNTCFSRCNAIAVAGSSSIANPCVECVVCQRFAWMCAIIMSWFFLCYFACLKYRYARAHIVVMFGSGFVVVDRGPVWLVVWALARASCALLSMSAEASARSRA